MLISFIGSPCSGKTTTAAMFFASLKDAGQLAEFVPEQARIYIAHKKQAEFQKHCDIENAKPEKVYGGIAPWSYPVTLTDQDQYEIMCQQRAADSLIYMTAGPGTTIVTDSSPINSLFYMSEEFQTVNAKNQAILDAANHTDLFFYVKPIPNQFEGDLLRLKQHNDKFSRDLDDKIIPTLIKLCPQIISRVIPLIGTADVRKVQALTAYYNLKFRQG